MEERRNFERVKIPLSAKVHVTTPQGQRVGNVLMLGRGGMMIATTTKFDNGDGAHFVIVDEASGIKTPVRATARYKTHEGFGFSFEGLKQDAALEIGVIIGKHHGKGRTA